MYNEVTIKRKGNTTQRQRLSTRDRKRETLIRSYQKRRFHAGALFINGSFNFCGLFSWRKTDLIKNFYFFYDPVVNKTIQLFAVINFRHLKIRLEFLRHTRPLIYPLYYFGRKKMSYLNGIYFYSRRGSSNETLQEITNNLRVVLLKNDDFILFM